VIQKGRRLVLEVNAIWKDYEGHPLLKGISFSVAEGETVCLLGSSGSGKTTLLRIIAGLEMCDSGEVKWDGKDLAGMPVHKRRFGLMFQEYALFPHQSVAQNVAFGLRMQGAPKEKINQRVSLLLEQMNMKAFANRHVTDLSGGEQQRVALARALAPDPRLLMLDEPLGALDRTLSEQLAGELRRLLKQTAIPAIYVTHNQVEAFTIADRILLLHEGQIVQAGTPEEVYRHPVSVWAAEFLGLQNLLEGEVVGTQPLRVQTLLGSLRCDSRLNENLSAGDNVTLLIEPSAFSLEPMGPDQEAISAVVEDQVFQGEGYRVDLRYSEGKTLRFFIDRKLPSEGKVQFWLNPSAITCLDA
jgi:ABC-type Fe3+/spermidine/putrescine transport system ATPase subunit